MEARGLFAAPHFIFRRVWRRCAVWYLLGSSYDNERRFQRIIPQSDGQLSDRSYGDHRGARALASSRDDREFADVGFARSTFAIGVHRSGRAVAVLHESPDAIWREHPERHAAGDFRTFRKT